jgi:nicotinamide-nucleotide amidase
VTDAPDASSAELAAGIVFALSERRATLAVAESLTGGLLCASLVAVPGASAVLRGGVVVYATELKHVLLGVDAALLAARGPVDAEVAVQLATGARERLGADWGVATTGVAGPLPVGEMPVGRVFVAVSGARAPERVRALDLPGDRAQVRAGAVTAALDLLRRALDGAADAGD